MGLKLEEVSRDSDFPALITCSRNAFTSPGTPLWPLFSGDYRPSLSLQQYTLEESTQRFLAWHRVDQTSHWLKVVDDETGKIVGGGRWALYVKEGSNPYEGHGDTEASWFEEGAPREIATLCLNQFLATSARLMGRPHAFLNILFTHPDHRRKGVASLIMKWGLERADKLGLESYIEATREGKPCYEAFGFRVLETNELVVEKGKGDQHYEEERREVEAALMPFRWWSMYRAVKV